MNSKTKLAILLSGVVVLSLSASSRLSYGDTTAKLPSHDPTTEWPIPPGMTFFSGPTYGGSGGGATWLMCPAVNGFSGTADSQLNSLSLKCFDEHGPMPDVGPLGTPRGIPFDEQCPPPLVAIGIVGGSGEYIDRLGLICGDQMHTTTYNTRIYGGPGGGPFSWMCPPNYYLVHLRVASGKYIDSVQPICTNR